MASNSSALPIELLAIILNEVAIPKPVALFPTLFVCRCFHDIAIPILYKDISIQVKINIEGKSDVGNVGMLFSLKASTHLALTVRFSLICINLPWYMPHCGVLEHIIRSMNSLEKLCLIIHEAEPTMLTSITSTTLTHLTFSAGVSPPTLRDALVAQPSLQYLRLTCCPGTVELPPDALPNLRSIVVFHGLWDRFATGRSIQHVHDSYLPDSHFLQPYNFLNSVISFKLRVGSVTCLRGLIQHLKSVEYLCLTVGDIKYEFMTQTDQSPTIDNYLAIPSKNLRYCNVGLLSLSSADSKQMFDKFPQLKALDSKTPSDLEPFIVERYLRDADHSIMKGFRALRQWEHWWENVCRDLE